MLRPMLLVGVGGSGGKTLQLLHRELRWRLRDAGWEAGVPSGWQFVHIDAPLQPDTGLGNDAVLINSVTVGGTYAPMSVSGVNYRSVDHVWLDGADEGELAATASWRPRPDDVGIALETGAGQFRTIGRVMALSQAHRIRDAVGTAMSRLTAPNVQPELHRLTDHLGGESAGVDQTPQVILISSIAGGSGAGMYLDIADIIRSSGPGGWQDTSMGILYTADVFADIPPASRIGVMPNSLAALCELMAGYWNADQPGDEFGALTRKGIATGGFTRRGVRFPMLVGRSNNKVDYPSQRSVYEASAKTLAGYMTSPAAQTSITAYLTGNWTASASGMSDNSGLKDGVKETVVSAMGMGSLSLGRDRFARYTARRLARASVDYLLRHHTEGLKVPEEVTPEAALEQAVLSNLEWFIGACGLDEIGEHRNQVLDALRPTKHEVDDGVRRHISSQLSQYSDALTPPEWARIILTEADEQERQYVSTTDTAIREKAAQWVPLITEQIESAYLETVARTGLDVATHLLERLVAHTGEVINDLTGEIQPLLNNAGRRDEGVYGAFKEWGEAPMTRENDLLNEAVKRVGLALDWDFEARLRRVACELLRDLSLNYLVPLQRASNEALGQLRIDEHPPAGAASIGIENWPTESIIPQSLHPALNERLVEPVDGFPLAYKDNLIATTRHQGESIGARAAERRAIGEIATGRVKGLESAEVLEHLSNWWPNMLSTQEAASMAAFSIHLAGGDLLERSEAWTHRRDTAIGDYVHESLRSYVLECDDPAMRANRRQRVLSAFSEVLAVSPPLVKVNNALLGKVHPDPLETQYHFTAIPFDQSDMRAEFEAIAANAGLNVDRSASLEAAFGVGDEQRIEIITTLSAPVQPLVLDSVLRPIADQWIKSKSNAGDRAAFWRWRRARPLTDFVPMSPDVRRWVERGWFLGRLLGEVRWDSEDLNSGAVRVWDTEFQREVDLPFPLIGAQLLNDTDLLPAVLESVGLAMVECHVQGTTEPLRPYNLLRSAGEQSAQTLTRWIRFGTTSAGTDPMVRAWRPPNSDMTSRAESSPADRQEAVVAYFRGRLRNYVEVFDDHPVGRANLLEQPRHLDLKRDLESVFGALIAEAIAVQTVIDDDGGD